MYIASTKYKKTTYLCALCNVQLLHIHTVEYILLYTYSHECFFLEVIIQMVTRIATGMARHRITTDRGATNNASPASVASE